MFFEAPRSSQTLEIEPKRWNGVQKRWCNLFMRKPSCLQKIKKRFPLGPPKPTEKSKQLKKEPPETELKKTFKTNTQNEPVLAMEREARLKEEREPNDS